MIMERNARIQLVPQTTANEKDHSIISDSHLIILSGALVSM